VRVRYVVEGEDSPAELEEKVCAEGDESPEGELEFGQRKPINSTSRGGKGSGPRLCSKGKTYERHNLLLDLLGQRDDLEE